MDCSHYITAHARRVKNLLFVRLVSLGGVLFHPNFSIGRATHAPSTDADRNKCLGCTRRTVVGYHQGMILSADTRQILEQVEQVTGRPVHLQGEVHWILETKGRVWEGTEQKDEAITDWCARFTAQTGHCWRFKRVNQRDFNAKRPAKLSNIEAWS